MRVRELLCERLLFSTSFSYSFFFKWYIFNSHLEKSSLILLCFQTLVIRQMLFSPSWYIKQLYEWLTVRILNLLPYHTIVTQVHSPITRPCWHLICLNGLINTYLQITLLLVLPTGFYTKWILFYIGFCGLAPSAKAIKWNA